MGSKIRFVVPVALLEVMERILPDFEQVSGDRFDLSIMLNPEVPGFIAGGAPWSVAASNPWHLSEIDATARGPVRPLGRSPLAICALGKSGPVARDADGISQVLRGGRRIGVTGAGTSGHTFKRLLGDLGFDSAFDDQVIPLDGGEPMKRLLGGDLDLAVLPLTNIAPVPGVHPVAICPWHMEVHVDFALCLHPNADAGTTAFADWLLSPERDATLAALGLERDR